MSRFHLDSCGSLLADLVDVVVLLAVAPVRLPHRHAAPVRADHHLLGRGIITLKLAMNLRTAFKDGPYYLLVESRY